MVRPARSPGYRRLVPDASTAIDSDSAVAVRLATAQLTALTRAAGRSARRVVTAQPFTALVTPDGPAYLSFAIAGAPGRPVHDLGDSLTMLAAAFEPHPVRLELIEESCPGAADLLLATGAELERRVPVMTVDTATVAAPNPPAGVDVVVARTVAERGGVASVQAAAFEADVGEPTGDAPPPADGGQVLATVDGVPAASASWSAVADGVCEIVAVATAPGFRRRGLATLVTAAAVRAAADHAGVTLAWLTPGGDDADRVYRGVGFRRVATAAHLAYRPPAS